MMLRACEVPDPDAHDVAPPRRRALRMCVAVAALAFGARPAAHAQADAPAQAATWAALREGGTVVLMRHAQTEPGVGDPPGWRLDQCSTQRNLSTAGREQARRVGAAFAARAVAIDEVRSSAWCRCVDTARLAFPAVPVQVWAPLNSFFEDRAQAPAQTAAVRAWIDRHAPRRNAVLVTHMVNIQALTGRAVAMGELLVMRPGAGAPQVVGALTL